jgi:hypothetical protein
MKRLGLRVIVICLVPVLSLTASACSSSGSRVAGAGTPAARPVEFDVPTTPQAADKTYAPGDRTPQALQAVAARDKRVVAAGFDQSFNVSRPLFLSSDDGGRSWVRRGLDQESVQRSSTFEGVTGMAAGPAGFVAIGTGYGGPVIWQSVDGTDWKRLPNDPKTFSETDSVSAITATAAGFAMVGSSSLAQAGNENHLVYWRSTDGRAWQRTAGPTIGLKPSVPGQVSAAEIVATGTTVVISGNLSTPADADQSDRLQYWYSTNGGKSFRTAAIRGEIASSYRVYNNALTAADGKFVALVQGAGFDDTDDGSWDGVLLEGGPSGASWQVVAEPWVLGSAYEDIPGTIVKAGRDWIVTSQMTTGTVDTTVAAGPSYPQLADRTDQQSQRGRGDQVVIDSTAIGNEAVMVGSNSRSGTVEPAVWRYAGKKVTPVALPADASGGRASSTVNQLLRAGDELVAVGDVSSSPTAWTRTPSGWQATTLPGRKNGVTIYQTAAAATPDGRVVAVGEKRLPIGERAAAWIRDSGGRWTELESPVFGVQASSPYGGPSARAIAVGRSGWVVVGQRHDGDGHFDAWSAMSKDGKTWTEGRGGRQLPADEEDDTRRTPSQNLRSVSTGAAEMTTVIAFGSRFVAGGDRGDGSPTVWLSPDGLNWTSVVKLPLAKTAHSATVRALGAIGNTLVAIGGYDRSDGDTEGGWTSWTSKDGGLTWSASSIAVPSRAFAGSLVSVPNGLVALGATGVRDELDAAAWFSRDGRSWRPVQLPGDRVKGPGRQGLVAAVADGGQLIAVAYDIPSYGGGYYTLKVEIPQ